MLVKKLTLREESPYLELFCPHFPAFRLSPRIQSEYGKMRTRKTPNTDTSTQCKKHKNKS